MAAIIGHYFVQIMFLFGFLVLYGMAISFFNNCFYTALGDRARPVVKLTGYLGIPVHELSHALMCVLFGHSVKKIELFNNRKKAKILGFVEHTYYPRNPYHQLGNFFIGISPIPAGGGVILLCLWLLVPSLFADITGEIATLLASFSGGLSDGFFGDLFSSVGRIAKGIFAPQNFLNPLYWLCLVLVVSVTIHMEISASDLRSGAKGFAVLAVMLFAADLVLGFLFPDAMLRFTGACVAVGIYEAFFLLVPAIFTAVIGGLSLLAMAFREMFGQKK